MERNEMAPVGSGPLINGAHVVYQVEKAARPALRDGCEMENRRAGEMALQDLARDEKKTKDAETKSTGSAFYKMLASCETSALQP